MNTITRAKATAAVIALVLSVSACAGGNEAANTGEDSADNAEKTADNAEQTADDGQGETGGTSGEQVDVAISDFSYEPKTVKVSAGDTVAWTNEDMFAHTVTHVKAKDDGGKFDGKLGDLDTVDAEGTTFEQTFNEPGTYEYFCRFHPDMRGTLVVKDA